ncbi:hypothetical protein [Litorilituus lipolyticus]|uniref:Uncharacterized protein n=1 Tax=Litorilituus lipolyticus TaxID=2491017 RepID=A0A502KZD9_9GAMM|nr:hypothetical protein [Litorilituus lipolyticus]TPH17060.1 hypothetical protein EPA86_05090 [Litorilituus lipolyticus]
MLYLKKLFLVTFVLFIVNGCTAIQKKEELPSPQVFRISNGLEVAMTPPPSFNITQEHYGFVQPESFSRIRITEKEVAYNNYITQLTKENLLKNQYQLIKNEQIDISGALCTLLTLRQNISGIYFEKMWLISGDNLSSIQIEASYPESSPNQLKNAIKSSLLSLSVATNQNLRLYTGLPFQFNQTPNFKIKQRYANSIVLLPSDSNDSKTSVVVSHGKLNQEIEDIKVLSDHFLKNGKHYKDVEVLQSEMIKIDNIPALAATAYVKLNDQPTFVYQALSYQKGKFLLIQGQTTKNQKAKFKLQLSKLLEHFSFK